MKKTFLVFILILVSLAAFGARDWFTNPVFNGDIDGLRFEWEFRIATDLTADTWLLGDTTAAGMFVPEQALEITDIILIASNSAAEDSFKVIVYSASSGTGVAEIAAQSSKHSGTGWKAVDDCTPSSTYKIITATEGLGIKWDHLGGSPNNATVKICGKYRQKDTLE